MYKNLNNLGFIIGIFFIIISLILILGGLLSKELSNPLNIYTGIGFFIFGFFMTILNRNMENKDGS